MNLFKKFVERLDWFLAGLMLLGVALFFVGVSLNMLVIAANGGSMPVTGEPDVMVNTGDIPRHYAKEGSANLLFLADCITIDFPEMTLPEGKFGNGIKEAVKLVDYPIEGGKQVVSVGDLMRWAGAALFLLMIPPLLLRIPFRLWRDGIRFQWRRRRSHHE